MYLTNRAGKILRDVVSAILYISQIVAIHRLCVR
jgi:hypothetical protein